MLFNFIIPILPERGKYGMKGIRNRIRQEFLMPLFIFGEVNSVFDMLDRSNVTKEEDELADPAGGNQGAGWVDSTLV